MKFLFCFGTRPEAIKMAPVIHSFKKQKIDFRICVTAQHREMLDQVLDFFEIVPDYDLDLMTPGQSLNVLSANIFSSIDKVFDDWLGFQQTQTDNVVLVQGDTTSAAMISLAAFHRGLKVGHIEAGLRTFNKAEPFPEEVNRQITSRIATWHFAPTANAKSNLLKEHILEEKIFLTGNTVVDALEWAITKIKLQHPGEEVSKIKALLNQKKKLILVTGHRRENFGKGLFNICEALLEIAERNDVEFIYPVHLNPNVKEPVNELLGNRKNIHLINPITYPTMLWLMQQCSLIISDSGGIQEEAPTFKKPVLVTRKVSERMEGVEAGFSVLVGTDIYKIVNEAFRLLDYPLDLSEINNPFGDGSAASRIVGILQIDPD